MSSKVTITFEEDTLLADYVSRHPCLYDLQHNAYKDIHIKENVWKKISTRLKKSGKYIYLHLIIIIIRL